MSNRKSRADKQKLFLIETNIINDLYEYVIMGTTGNAYTVTMHESPTCSCPDHVTRKTRCKHIYFVLLKILHTDDTLIDKDQYTIDELAKICVNDKEISNVFYVDDDLRKKYTHQKNKTNTTNRKDTDDDCPICLDPLENGEELDYCKHGCGKHIHVQCLNMWATRHSKICVFCKSDWNIATYINLSTPSS